MGVEPGKHHGLITERAAAAVHRARVAAPHAKFCSGAGKEKATGLVEAKQALEVEEPAVHDIESTRFGHELVEDVHFVHFSVANMDKRRNVAAQIEQGVQFDGSFGSAKRSPRKNRKTQIDGGSVECVDGLLQIDTKGVLRIERTRHGNQALREISIDTPVA